MFQRKTLLTETTLVRSNSNLDKDTHQHLLHLFCFEHFILKSIPWEEMCDKGNYPQNLALPLALALVKVLGLAIPILKALFKAF